MESRIGQMVEVLETLHKIDSGLPSTHSQINHGIKEIRDLTVQLVVKWAALEDTLEVKEVS